MCLRRGRNGLSAPHSADGHWTASLWPGPRRTTTLLARSMRLQESPSLPGRKAFNPAAFTLPPKGQQGDFGRNVLRVFGAWQADFALQRQFHLTENVGLRFR